MIERVKKLLVSDYLSKMNQRSAKSYREDMMDAWLDGFEAALKLKSEISASTPEAKDEK